MWVRPVLRYGELQPDHLVDQQGRRAGLLDTVHLQLLEHRPAPPHSEDWLVDPRRGWVRVTWPSSRIDRRALLRDFAETSPDTVLSGTTRSLCLVGPVEVVGLYFDPANRYGKYDARLIFRLNDSEYHPSRHAPGMVCTDVKFRALGRTLVTNDKPLMLAWSAAAKHLHVEHVYLAIGLARPHEGRLYPMVVGFHTVPDYDVEVDYANP